MRDFLPLQEEVYLTAGSPRACVLITILHNRIVTGRAPLTLSVEIADVRTVSGSIVPSLIGRDHTVAITDIDCKLFFYE